MVKVGSKRSVAEIETDEVPPKKQRVSGVDSATLSQDTSVIDARSRELCQPWDIEQFFERINTFSPINWFQKPECMAPMVCAQYGWVCTGGNLISCQVCKQQHHFSMATTLTPAAAQALQDGFVETIKLTGHDPRCPWRGNPCADSFLQLPREEPLLRDMFQRNVRSFEPDVDGLYTLPRLDESTRRRIIEEIPESKEHGDVTDVMILSACGWKQRHIAPDVGNSNAHPSASSCLECRYCNKKIFLSQYEFYRTPSITPENTIELDEDVVLENPVEDSDSKMSESNTLHTTSQPSATASSPSNSGENFLERSLNDDDPQSLAEKLKRIGFESSTSPRSQWLTIYPTKALQNFPQFISQSDSVFGVNRPMSVSMSSGMWPRRSLLTQQSVAEDGAQRASGNRRKKRRRSSTPDTPENRVKRIRQSEQEEKSYAPPPDYEASLSEPSPRQSHKRRKPDDDDDQEMVGSRQGKRARLSPSGPLTEQSLNVQGSRKRQLVEADREQAEEPPPKKRRSVAPAVTTNRYFDPIHEHKSPCPYISATKLNDESVPGWFLTVRAIPRNIL